VDAAAGHHREKKSAPATSSTAKPSANTSSLAKDPVSPDAAETAAAAATLGKTAHSSAEKSSADGARAAAEAGQHREKKSKGSKASTASSCSAKASPDSSTTCQPASAKEAGIAVREAAEKAAPTATPVKTSKADSSAAVADSAADRSGAAIAADSGRHKGKKSKSTSVSSSAEPSHDTSSKGHAGEAGPADPEAVEMAAPAATLVEISLVESSAAIGDSSAAVEAAEREGPAIDAAVGHHRGKKSKSTAVSSSGEPSPDTSSKGPVSSHAEEVGSPGSEAGEMAAPAAPVVEISLVDPSAALADSSAAEVAVDREGPAIDVAAGHHRGKKSKSTAGFSSAGPSHDTCSKGPESSHAEEVCPERADPAETAAPAATLIEAPKAHSSVAASAAETERPSMAAAVVGHHRGKKSKSKSVTIVEASANEGSKGPAPSTTEVAAAVEAVEAQPSAALVPAVEELLSPLTSARSAKDGAGAPTALAAVTEKTSRSAAVSSSSTPGAGMSSTGLLSTSVPALPAEIGSPDAATAAVPLEASVAEAPAVPPSPRAAARSAAVSDSATHSVAASSRDLSLPLAALARSASAETAATQEDASPEDSLVIPKRWRTASWQQDEPGDWMGSSSSCSSDSGGASAGIKAFKSLPNLGAGTQHRRSSAPLPDLRLKLRLGQEDEEEEKHLPCWDRGVSITVARLHRQASGRPRRFTKERRSRSLEDKGRGGETPLTRAPSRQVVADGRDRVHQLEETLEEYERELGELEARLNEEIAPQVREPSAKFRRGSEQVTAWRNDCRRLSLRVGEVAADALESSCNRDMFSAMDVFEQANYAVDRMAGLLKSLAHAELEADAPAGVDPVEWRLVVTAAQGNELEALRSLLDQVQSTLSSTQSSASSGSRAVRRDLWEKPATLLRFLRAQEGRVPEAAEMFLASMEWRRSYRIDEKSEAWMRELGTDKTWVAKLVNSCKVHKVIAKDRLGLPVYLFRWSVFDVAGAERELGTELTLLIILSIHEQVVNAMNQAMIKQQAYMPGVLFIWDIGNYGQHGVPHWWSRMLALVRFLPKVAKLLEANYPEVVRRIMVVRCGAATKALYHTAAPLLPSKTLGKCKLYGWRAAEWLPELREEVPTCKLPAFLESDDDSALAMAEPRGGLYSAGAAAAARLAESGGE